MPKVQGGSGGGVFDNISPGTSWRHLGGVRGDFIPHPLRNLRPIKFPSWWHSRAYGSKWQNDRGVGGSTGPTYNTIVILEEVNWPYPRCPQCDHLISVHTLNGRHPVNYLCRFGWGRRWQCLETE